MADISIPNTFVANNTAAAAGVNANFDEVEDKFNASIASVLADSTTAGRLIVANGSGVPTYVTASGDISFSSAGAATVNQRQSYSDATERTTTSSSYVQLTGALQGSLTFGASGGIIWVLYRASWKLAGSSGGTAQAIAAIHIAGTALPYTYISHGQDSYLGLFSSPSFNGVATTGGYSGLVPDGTAIGSLPAIHGSINTTYAPDLITTWAAVPVEVASGTHTVDVRYKLGGSDGGTVTVKDRKLALWGQAF